MCSQGSTAEESLEEEEAVRQRTPPAVDVLGGNPQAAQNVAGELPRHAPQPVKAAPRSDPPLTCPSSVPLPESNDSALYSMENAATSISPGTPPFSGNSEENISQKAPVEESVAGVLGSLPTLLTKDCSSSIGIQTLSPLSPPLTSDKQVDGAEQKVHYGSQIDKEKSCSVIPTNEIQLPGGEWTGLGVRMDTKENQPVVLEYKPETGTNAKLDGKEHTISQSQSGLAPSPLPQSGVVFKDDSDSSDRKLCDGEEIPSGAGTLAATAEQTDGQQDAWPSLLASLSPSDVKETDISKTQPNYTDASSNGRQTQRANSPEAQHDEETPPPPSDEILENVKAEKLLPGLGGDPASGSGGPPDGEQLQSCEDGLGTAVVSFTASMEEDRPPAVYDASLVVSLQAEQVVVPAEASHSSEQVVATEALVHSVHTQEIVVVGEDGQLGADWADVQLNQSYLLQREDGSVCQLAAATHGVEGELELHSQPVEVYEFCSLVEEVAEETVCGGPGSHSPEYEVNLFNALLEHSEDLKQELHLDPSLHAISEGETVIITQQLAPPSQHDATQTEPPLLPRPDGSLSLKGSRVAAIGQHLVLDTNRTVQVAANSGEVCLVQVAAEAPQAFAIQRGGDGLQIVTPGSQLVEEVVEVMGDDSGAPPAEAATDVLSLVSACGDTAVSLPVAVTVHVSHGRQHSSPEVTVVSTAASSLPNFPKTLTAVNSNLLLKPGGLHPLKPPPSLPLQVSSQQRSSGQLANAIGSQPDGAATECLSQPVAAADQTQCAVTQIPATSLPSRAANEALMDKTQPAENFHPVSEDNIAPAAVITPNSLMALPPSSGSPSDPEPQDSLYTEEDLDDMDPMDQDEGLGDGDTLEATSGQISSPEEASDEDPDKTEGDMTTPARSHKVILALSFSSFSDAALCTELTQVSVKVLMHPGHFTREGYWICFWHLEDLSLSC